MPLIDTVEEIADFLNSPRRTWIVLDPKGRQFTGPELQDFLENNYTTHTRSDLLSIYVNCQEPPCELQQVNQEDAPHAQDAMGN